MTSPTLRIAVIGDGKMGKAVAGIARDAGHGVAAIIGDGTPITRDSLADADVAIEFTEPSAAVGNAKACIDAGCPVVLGTTGWYSRLDELTQYVTAHRGRLLWAANFSLGVHIFAELARHAGQLLSRVPKFDAHLVETHHTAKKDAPSGTALMLRDATMSTLGRDIPITSVRVGSVPGTHELVFDATYEQITLTHLARDRRVFAEGAVAAAQWLAPRTNTTGVFTLADMLGTKES
jgi:4-hydroxy-tetrahydrodipicolinate reductase